MCVPASNSGQVMTANREQVCGPRAGARSELRPGREEREGEGEKEYKTHVDMRGRLGRHGDHDNLCVKYR